MDDRFRASDADRDRVADALREHYAVGRLSADELDERLTTALGARTLGELNRVLTDLPGPARALPQPGGWRPPQSAPVWVTVRRRPRPRVAPLVLLALLVALVLPGAGWVLFTVLQAFLLFMLVGALAATFFAARFWRRARREWTRMSEDYGGYGPGHSHHPNWPGGWNRHQFGSWSP
ncbi:MAG TPA: DUF1707 domain-containing protein [Streptosporangiaceae bacterium]